MMQDTKQSEKTTKNTWVNALLKKATNAFWNANHNVIVSQLNAESVLGTLKDKDGVTVQIDAKDFGPNLPEVGDEITVYIGDPADSNEDLTSDFPQNTTLPASFITARDLQEISTLRSAYKKHEQVQGIMLGKLKGGYLVSLFADDFADKACKGIRAFLPLSQATLRHNDTFNFEVGDSYSFDIEQFQANKGNLIVSRRGFLLQQRQSKAQERWQELRAGMQVEGEVKSITDYGAFVDVGGIDGLLHMTDFAWGRVKKPSDFLKVGQKLSLKVLECDTEKRRLKLGLKQMNANPFENLEKRFSPGSVVEGHIVAFADFGLFLSLEDGLEGLVHLSEIAWQRIKHPSQLFHIGQTIKAKVLSVDPKSKKLSLSIKALEHDPLQDLIVNYPEGAILTAKIVSVQEFGAIVELSPHMHGFVPNSEISWTEKFKHPSEVLKEGQNAEIKILSYDMVRRRVLCSIKKAGKNPWSAWGKEFAQGTVHTVVVTKYLEKGVECKLMEDLTGFCPLRELSDERVSRPQDAVRLGDKLEVIVTEIDPKRRRISLSARKKAEKETRDAYRDYMDKQEKQSSGKTTLGDMLKKKK